MNKEAGACLPAETLDDTIDHPLAIHFVLLFPLLEDLIVIAGSAVVASSGDFPNELLTATQPLT